MGLAAVLTPGSMIHMPRADVGDIRVGAVQDAGKHRRHLHHQEHGEGDSDQQREELAPVVDQQLESDAQNTPVLHGDSRRSVRCGAFHHPPPNATYSATVSW